MHPNTRTVLVYAVTSNELKSQKKNRKIYDAVALNVHHLIRKLWQTEDNSVVGRFSHKSHKIRAQTFLMNAEKVERGIRCIRANRVVLHIYHKWKSMNIIALFAFFIFIFLLFIALLASAQSNGSCVWCMELLTSFEWKEVLHLLWKEI